METILPLIRLLIEVGQHGSHNSFDMNLPVQV